MTCPAGVPGCDGKPDAAATVDYRCPVTGTATCMCPSASACRETWKADREHDELVALRREVAAAEAACRVKDEALRTCEPIVCGRFGEPLTSSEVRYAEKVLRAALTPPADALRAEINAFMDAVGDVLDEWDVEPRSEFDRAMTEAFIKRYG